MTDGVDVTDKSQPNEAVLFALNGRNVLTGGRRGQEVNEMHERNESAATSSRFSCGITSILCRCPCVCVTVRAAYVRILHWPCFGSPREGLSNEPAAATRLNDAQSRQGIKS